MPPALGRSDPSLTAPESERRVTIDARGRLLLRCWSRSGRRGVRWLRGPSRGDDLRARGDSRAVEHDRRPARRRRPRRPPCRNGRSPPTAASTRLLRRRR
jgi:hypothetical protein